MSEQAAPVPSQSVTREQAILIGCRLFAAFLLFWVVDDLTLLPRELLSVLHYMRETQSVLARNTSMPITSFYQIDSVIVLLSTILRMVLWIVGAGWFYRCGPKVAAFLGGENE